MSYEKKVRDGWKATLHSSLTSQVNTLQTPFKITKTPEYTLKSHGLSIEIFT